MNDFTDSAIIKTANIDGDEFRCDVDFRKRSIYFENSTDDNGQYMTLTPNQAASIGAELIKFSVDMGCSQTTPFIAEQIELKEPASGDYGGIKKALRLVDSGRIVLLKAIVAKDPESHHRALIFNNSGDGVQWVYLPDYIECEDLKDAP